ncbi:FtsW/RodA/SpoVE family cell cycle protein [Paraurantiacibacter namhicola]|uniref:Probable peptidoglycan glycosyltransferase FtsW n=1 Tax=Paraurantiacibacter namhicola TaxID=645517 RepID=A0A1C7DAS2_9SPHN|nr:putative peptidoglycan glycosyltransferase FtsW [Paraurantiacibacter namhicola]ANU08545.1 Lipid II flippase FtsW [Paraurantiacibacter namhicola]
MNAKRPYVPLPGQSPPPAPRLRRDWKDHVRIWWREVDRVLLGLILGLMVLGSLAVAVASPASAARLSTSETTLPGSYFWMRHIVWQVMGLATMIGISLVPREHLRRGGIVAAAVFFGFLMLVPLIGSEVNGARRWLDLGMRFQPSEFLKPGFAIVLAWVLSWRTRDPDMPVIQTSGAMLAAVVFLMMLQPNLGGAILFVGAWFVMVLLAGLPVQRVAVMAGLGSMALVAAYLFYDNARHRIDAFLGGGTAFDQVDLASRTLMAGGWTGTGLWLGEQKMRLPEAHTDYIFSVIGEELGLLTCAVVVILYLSIVLRVFVRMVGEEDIFRLLAASGLAAFFGGQAFINMLVNLQLFPSKGMTLPLVSYGGSSTIATCAVVGLLLAFTRRNPFLSREGLAFANRRGQKVPFDRRAGQSARDAGKGIAA